MSLMSTPDPTTVSSPEGPAGPTITVNTKHLKRKGVYVFTKRGIYWGLTPDEVQEMHNLTGELLAAQETE